MKSYKKRKYKKKIIRSRNKSNYTVRMRGGNEKGMPPKVVEVICNVSKEKERLRTLNPILDFYNISPSYAVYGEDTKAHHLYKKFTPESTLAEISLTINHVMTLDKHKNDNKYVVVLESDALPLYDMKTVNSMLNETVEQMKANNIDFVFVGKGHLDTVDTSSYTKITDTLFKTDGSRCTESYIVSNNGIKKYLEFFHNNNNNVTPDLNYNRFFKENSECIVCWRVPEIFKQDKSHKSLLR